MANLGTPTKFGSVWVIALAVAGLISWDIYAAMSPLQPTESAFVLHYARLHPLLPFSFGVLMGHFFWPQQVPTDSETKPEVKP